MRTYTYKRYIKTIARMAFGLIVVLVSSCEADAERWLGNPVAASFVPSINEQDADVTRVVNQTWYTTDIVGVAMAGTGVLDTGYKQYKPKTEGTPVTLEPTAANQTLYYPIAGNEVTFTAFCPYQAPASGVVTYNSFATQNGTDNTNMQAVDLIYSSGSKGKAGTPTATLGFTHKFSKLTINVTKDASITDALTGLAMTVTGVPTTATCTLSTGAVAVSAAGTITPFHENTTDAGKATLIIPPHSGAKFTGRTITFKIGSLNYSYTLPTTDDFKFEAGKEYTFDFTLTQTAPILSGSTIAAWGGGELAWDKDGNTLNAPEEVKHYKDATVGNKIVITTNHTATPDIQYSTSATEVTGTATVISYFNQTAFTKTKTTSPYEWTLTYDLLENTGATSREAYIHVTVGTMKVVVKVVQSRTLNILDGDANCFIVAPGNTINFSLSRPISQGTASYDATFKVEKLWDDTPGEAVTSVTMTTGTETKAITVVAGANPGNALVAVKVGEEIVWSYHIWVTDYNPDNGGATFTNTWNNNNNGSHFVFMDRNLGATFAGRGYGAGTGLFYQWGRKDPFPTTLEPGEAQPGGGTFWTAATNPTNGTIANTIKHPHIFYTAGESSEYDWYWGATGSARSDRNNTLWGHGNTTPKSVYDPCPAGWRVPSHNVAANAYATIESSPWYGFADDSNTKPINLNPEGWDSGYSWGVNAQYPTTGLRFSIAGIAPAGWNAACTWIYSASCDADRGAMVLAIDSYVPRPAPATVMVNNNLMRAHGKSVRCTRES